VSYYSGYDVEQLWQMIDAARQGLQPSHDQVAALNKAQQMLSGHAQSLEQARDQLAAKWPPQTNAASAAYLGELDRLIDAVRDTALSCAVNVFHINIVSEALIQTHDALAPLHDEFVKNERALAFYDAEINAFGNGAAAIPGSSAIASGTAKFFTSPPVEEGRQDDLTRQAQKAMASLADAAQQGAAYIKPPAPYVPPTVGGPIDESATELPEGSFGGSFDGALTTPIDSPAYTRRQTDTTTPQIGGETARPPIGKPGPGLSGLSPTPTEPTPERTPHIGTTSPIAPGTQIGLIPHLKPTVGYGERLPNSPLPTNRANVGRGPFSTNDAVRDGVIGNVPIDKGVVAPAPSRVNTPAGVLAQQPGPQRAGAADRRVASGSDTKTAGSQTRRTRESAAEDKARWDPDNPWEIREGVDPVIMAVLPPERIDPGPGIIGIDR